MANEQMKYECLRCGWIYDPAEGDPDGGIKPGTPFKDIPNSLHIRKTSGPDPEAGIFHTLHINVPSRRRRILWRE